MATVNTPASAPALPRPAPGDDSPLWGRIGLGRRLPALLLALRPPDGWVAAALLTLNMIIVVWSVEAADWAPTPSLALVMLLAVLTALLLARLPFWTALILPVGLIVGAAVIIWQLTVASPAELQVATAAELFDRLGQWLRAARTDGISVDPLPFAVGLLIAAWLSGYLAGWVFFRHRNFWGVFALGAVGLLSNLTFLPDDAAIYLAIYLFTGLLLVGWVQSVRARQCWDRQGRIYDGHLGILTVSDTAAVALIALLIAFLLPAGSQWAPANALYSFSRAPMVGWEEDFNRLFAGLPARRPLPYRIWGDTMAFQGTINPTDTPVLQVNSPVPLYWKARSYAQYTHEGWLSDATILREPGWQPQYSAPNPDQKRFNITYEVIPHYDSRSLFAGGQAVAANRDIRIETFDSPRYVINPHQDSPADHRPPLLQQAVAGVRGAVAADPNAADAAIAAGLPPSFVLESVARDPAGSVTAAVIAEIVPAAPDVLSVRAAGGSAPSGEPYQLTASVSAAPPDDLRAAGSDYAPWVWTRYTQLPPDLPPRVAELARRIAAGAPTPYDQALAVEAYLKNNLTYNLAIDPPPFGADGVDHFLFNSREGYSEYFGSAMTVLMRSLGVPARMTTGYTAGQPAAGGNLYIVSDHHSHGWTEVYFPGYGWIPFEPTPGKAIPVAAPPQEQTPPVGIGADAAGAGELPCEIEEDCEDFEALLDDGTPISANPANTGWRRAAQAALPWTIAAGIAAFLTAVAAWTLWRWLLATPSDIPTAYRRLRRLARLASLPAQAHQTPHQWAAHLAAAMPQNRAAIAQIVNAYARHTYSNHPHPPATPSNTDTNTDTDSNAAIAQAWQSLRFPLAWYALRRRET